MLTHCKKYKIKIYEVMRQTKVALGRRGPTGSARNRKRKSDIHHTPGSHHCQPRSNRSSTRGSRLKWTGNGLFRLRVTPPSPLAYCVLPYFGLAYCVPPIFGLASCVPFNDKNNIFGVSIHIKKIKMTVCCMHMYNNSYKR